MLVEPILYEGKVVAVIEIGSLEIFGESQLEFFEEAKGAIGVALHAAGSRARVQMLLSQTAEQAERLHAQREELKTANDGLHERSDDLEQSKALLQEQTEELKVANEELEEKGESLEKQTAAAVHQNEKIARAKEALEEQARELTLASKYKSEFLANMSHELRTPLNSLLILSEGLAKNKEGNLTHKQIEKAKIIHGGGEDLLHLINDILDLSKVEAGKLDVQLEDVDPGEILEDLERYFTPVAGQKNLGFSVVVEEGVPSSVHTDSQRIKQILRNLTSNALKFTETGSVEIHLHRAAAGVRFFDESLNPGSMIGFSVIDTGIGVPEDKQRAIFEAFQQADGTTSRRFGGTGLGLTISRELAKLLGGEIAIQSAQGKGSTFTLYVPAEGRERPSKASSPAGSQVLATSRTNHVRSAPEQSLPDSPPNISFVPDDRLEIGPEDRTVLIIEDDQAFASIMVEFSRERGFKCLTAGDGRSGIELAKKHVPDAIILDIGLPEIDGLRVLEFLKTDSKTRHIPVHTVSAMDEAVAVMQKGALGSIKKPASEPALMQMFDRFENALETSIRRLLVVEDEAIAQAAIRDLLQAEGLEITIVASGKEARREVLATPFDCIILDMNLEDMTGLEFLRGLHSEGVNQLPPVIVYTGKELNSEEEHELHRYARSIVLKGAGSPERLLDDVSLFLHTVEASLPIELRSDIRIQRDPDDSLRGKKILLVDDDMRNIFALTELLEEVGCHVLPAGNGEAGLRVLGEHDDIDLIIMDIMMPIMDGLEAMEKLREDPRHVDLPVIALTALATPQDRVKCLEAGASDYLTKPVNMEQIGSLMRVWLER
ncbi:MAG: response regulator [Gammaproteobacteria bacterium]|nr:response regulator [Gammaproteobacteria bacterium]